MSSHSSEEKLPLKLTGVERQAVLNNLRSLSQPLARIIEQAPQGRPVLMNRNELLVFLRQLLDEGERANVVHAKTWDTLAKRIARIATPPAPVTPLTRHVSRPAIPTDEIFQLKITLAGAEPPVWRRIQFQDCTLHELHRYIQVAMGWKDDHLHEFETDDARYSPSPGPTAFSFMGAKPEVDSNKTLVSQIVPADRPAGFGFSYVYDFGDSWHHELLFEGCVPRDASGAYPVCLEGARACPPENIGGVYGYHDLLCYLESRASQQAAPKPEAAPSDDVECEHDEADDDDYESDVDDDEGDEYEEFDSYDDFLPDKFDAAETTQALRKFARR